MSEYLKEWIIFIDLYIGSMKRRRIYTLVQWMKTSYTQVVPNTEAYARMLQVIEIAYIFWVVI